MNELINVLMVFTLLAPSGKPIPHAKLQCIEIGRMVDERQSEAELDVDGVGAVLITDSGGRMMIDTTPNMMLHCAAYADGYKRTTFSYMVTKMDKLSVTLPKETK